MRDLTPNPRRAVGAVLAATPLPPVGDPQVTVAYQVDTFGEMRVYEPLTGPAGPIAARQASRLLREHAAWLRAELGATNRAAAATDRRAAAIDAEYGTANTEETTA